MKRKYLSLLLLAFLFGSSLFHAPVEAMATGTNSSEESIVLKKPSLYINAKGKVDIVSENGEIRKKESLITEFLDKYRFTVAGITAVGSVSMILFFIIGFIRLGAFSDNPVQRSMVIRGLVASGIAAAGLGAVALITGVFYNALI